jgi:proteasome accessory factor B
VFRLSRVVGPARATGSPGAFDVPAGTDVRDVARRLAPVGPSEEAVVLARLGAGAVLRRAAGDVERDVAGPDDATPWDRLRLPGGAQADEVLALGADVYVEQPASLRDEVVARLRAAAEVLS